MINVFFNPSQTANFVTTNMTSTTISSGGYFFTCSLDNWWYPTISLGPGTPTGRPTSVVWPNGMEAQTLTAGPSGSLTTQVPATKRMDGNPFDLQAFTGKILGNTAAAGASFEIMPQLNGQDAFDNPLLYDATGYAGNSFTYSPALTGYDTYIVSLWMDFALTGLTLVDAECSTGDADVDNLVELRPAELAHQRCGLLVATKLGFELERAGEQPQMRLAPPAPIIRWC